MQAKRNKKLRKLKITFIILVMHPPFDILIRNTLRFNNKLKRFCKPLEEHFFVNHFWWYAISHEGHYSCLGTNAEWTEYYFSEKFYLNNPYLRSPKNYKSGIVLLKSSLPDSFDLSQKMGIEKFNLNQSLVFLEETVKGIQGFGFRTRLTSIEFEILCLNERQLLQFFIKEFKEKFCRVLNYMEENPIDLANLIGPAFYQENTPKKIYKLDKDQFLKKMKYPIPPKLTKREAEVLHFVLLGSSASQIAEQLNLSRRTVEHYVDHIKYKFNCFSKSELISKTHEIQALGYFIP